MGDLKIINQVRKLKFERVKKIFLHQTSGLDRKGDAGSGEDAPLPLNGEGSCCATESIPFYGYVQDL